MITAVVLTLGLRLSDADKRYNAGVELLEEGRFEEAIKDYT